MRYFKLIEAVKSLINPFIGAADDAAPAKAEGGSHEAHSRTVLVDRRSPKDLVCALAFELPQQDGQGEQGLLHTIQKVLDHSVNTWDQGFLDKLYASTNPVC